VVFEKTIENPAVRSLERVTKLFYVSAFVQGLGAIYYFLTIAPRKPLTGSLLVGVTVLTAMLAFVTARGLEEQRPWARNAGYIQAALALLSPPLGTILGLASIYFLWRASREGLFRAGGAPA
jgi:hypothetical protein